jgi:hypothetical protein
MIGHNYQFKQSNPKLINNSIPQMRSNSFQPPFYSPQSQTPLNLGKKAFEYTHYEKTEPIKFRK